MRAIEYSAERGKVNPSGSNLPVVAALVREERPRIKTDNGLREPRNAEAQAPRWHRDDHGEDRVPRHHPDPAAHLRRRSADDRPEGAKLLKAGSRMSPKT